MNEIALLIPQVQYHAHRSDAASVLGHTEAPIMKWRRTVLALLCIGLVGACGSGSTALRVNVRVAAGKPVIGQPCGTDQLPVWAQDVPGAQVIVSNETNTIIGTVPLPSNWTTSPRTTSGQFPDNLLDKYCTFSVSVTATGDANFYSVKVGQRQAQTYSRAQLEAAQWTSDLAIVSGS